MRHIITAFACLLSFSVSGQGWEQTYGGSDEERGFSVQQTSDGGYITAGKTDSFGNGSFDVYLIKTDGSGVEQWSQTYGGTGDDVGASVQQTSDGGYIIAGWTYSFGNGSSDVYLIKTDGNGVEQWSQTYGGTNPDGGKSVQQTSDGGYIICGYTGSFGVSYDAYLIKTDGNGVEQWSQTFDGSGSFDSFSSVQQTTDGGYIMCGYTDNYIDYYYNDDDVYLIKTDGNGVEQWNQTYGSGYYYEAGYSVDQTTDGGYIIVGTLESPYIGTLPAGQIILIKTDSNGDEQWYQYYGISGYEYGKSVKQTTDGGYIMCGHRGSFFADNSEDVYLIKTDGNGVEQWSQTYGETDTDMGFSVQQTTDGGYIIGGTSWSNETGYDVYLIKTDSEGTLSSSFTISTPSSNRKLDKVIDALGREVNHTTNQILFHLYDDGSVEKKFVVE
jgi:hypothetical protein